MVGTDKSTELWRHPKLCFLLFFGVPSSSPPTWRFDLKKTITGEKCFAGGRKTILCSKVAKEEECCYIFSLLNMGRKRNECDGEKRGREIESLGKSVCACQY